MKDPQEIAQQVGMSCECVICWDCKLKLAAAIQARDEEREQDLEKLFVERDEIQDAFDELVSKLEVETEYSNLRGFEEILEDCQIAIDSGVGKQWLEKYGDPCKLEAELDALRKERDNRWQPIKTVPRDGRTIFIWYAGECVHAAYFAEHHGRIPNWYLLDKWRNWGPVSESPKFWMPLPLEPGVQPAGEEKK